MIYKGKNGQFFRLEDLHQDNKSPLVEKIDKEKTLLWFLDNDTVLKIDEKPYSFKKNQVITLTEFYHLEAVNLGEIKMFQFNRDFYCIVEHDSEVDCKGILFFGAFELPIITLSEDDQEKLCVVLKMMESEIIVERELQESMLQTLMKQILIIITRRYKLQMDLYGIQKSQLDIIRQFTFLVEKNYKEIHTVAEFADMMHKSPKTLSNVFIKNGYNSPIKFIQERRLLDARRKLQYTDLTINEIAYSLNFTDAQTFSKFFKRLINQSPTAFRKGFKN